MSCNCSQQAQSSGCSQCKPSDADLQALAISWVAGNNECDTTQMTNNVALWWALFERQSCGSPDVRMLLVARQIATTLIAQYARQIDIASSRRERQVRGAGKMRNAGWSRAQATASGVRFADALNKSEYNDFSNSLMNSASNRDRGSSNFANSGNAAQSYSVGGSGMTSYRRSQGEGVRRDRSSFDRNSLGAGRSESHSDAQGNQGNFFSGFGFIGISTSPTSGFVSGQGQSNGFAFNARNDTQNSFGTVNGYTESVGSSGMLSSSFGVGQGSSSASGASGSSMNDDGSAFRTSGSHGEGQGVGQGGSNSQSRSSTQGSSDSEGSGFSEFNQTGSGLIIADSAKAHQRVEHLHDLVKRFTDQIHELRKYKSSNMAARLTQASFVCGCGDSKGFTSYENSKTTTCGCGV